MLGQKPGTVQISDWIGRDSTNKEFPVSALIGELERDYLCSAIEDEYMIYLQILYQSVNINQVDMINMIAVAKQNCPKLDFHM